jgi:outer membrane biosynthesis protein TonB
MTSVILTMNQKERSSAATLSAIVISSLLATAIFFNGNMNFSQKAVGQAEETFGGNATFAEELAANQTAATTTPPPPTPPPTPPANQTTPPPTPPPTPPANQTTPPPPTTAANVTTNVTSEDIQPVLDSLSTAREGLQENDTEAALGAINDADETLFTLVNEEGDQGGLAEQLKTLQESLDTARESLHNDDPAKALEDLNTADTQVLAITQALPADEEPEDEEPEDEEPEDEEPEDEE